MQHDDGSLISGIRNRLEGLFGSIDWSAQAGVLHVAAIQRRSALTIALGPDAPRSDTDRFCLGFARARADAIVTTGAILRAEPDLVHRYAESDSDDRAWAQWRRVELGREERPRLLVMTETGAISADHPALVATKGWIWTTQEGRSRIGSPPRGFEYAEGGHRERDMKGVIDFLLGTAGIDCISIEAGPTATAPLYVPAAETARVDELLLSCFEGELSPQAAGPAFVPAADRMRCLGETPASTRLRTERSGSWSFERWRASEP
jgi:riboflavin biosynthesis pyrimidine reductase